MDVVENTLPIAQNLALVPTLVVGLPYVLSAMKISDFYPTTGETKTFSQPEGTQEDTSHKIGELSKRLENVEQCCDECQKCDDKKEDKKEDEGPDNETLKKLYGALKEFISLLTSDIVRIISTISSLAPHVLRLVLKLVKLLKLSFAFIWKQSKIISGKYSAYKKNKARQKLKKTSKAVIKTRNQLKAILQKAEAGDIILKPEQKQKILKHLNKQ